MDEPTPPTYRVAPELDDPRQLRLVIVARPYGALT